MKSDGRFICVLPPKGLDLRAGTRKCTDAKVAQTLSQFHLNSQVWLSDGGGVAVSTPASAPARALVRPEVFCSDSMIVAFCGELTNLEELTARTLYKELCEAGGLPQQNLSARVVGMLYAQTGDPMKVLSKLQGQFSFAVMDTESVRIFAARDNAGGMPLYQGRLPDGTLVVSNFTPEGLEMEVEVPGGHYLFGNRRGNVPQKFSPALEDLERDTTKAQSAAMRALEGLTIKRTPLVLNSTFTVVVSKAQKRHSAKTRAEPATAHRPSANNKPSHAKPSGVASAAGSSRNKHATNSKSRRPDTPGVVAVASRSNDGRADGSAWWRKAAPPQKSAPVTIADTTPPSAPVTLVATPSEPPAHAKEQAMPIATIVPQKEQIEEAVRILHKIASSGKIQIMLQQNEQQGEAGAAGAARGMARRVPSCSNLSRVESMKRIPSMQRVGSDLQTLVTL